MRKPIGSSDLTFRATDRSLGGSICRVSVHLRLCLDRSKPLLGLVLPVIFAVPLLGQTNTAPDAGNPSFDIPSRQYLFGNWGGKRTALEEKGIKFDFFYVADLEAKPSGGLQQTKAGWQRIRGTIDVNFDQLMKWQGLRFHATGLWQVGANLGAKIGTLANPSDLVSAHTTRLDSFWLEQDFLEAKIRLRAGQLAGLDFYGNQEYGGSWLIEPMGYAFGTRSVQFLNPSIPPVHPGRRCVSLPDATSTLRAPSWQAIAIHIIKTLPARISRFVIPQIFCSRRATWYIHQMAIS